MLSASDAQTDIPPAPPAPEESNHDRKWRLFLRAVRIAKVCGKKTRLPDRQDLEMAYGLVPWMEGLSEAPRGAWDEVVAADPDGTG
jgi:hypothetical protein